MVGVTPLEVRSSSGTRSACSIAPIACETADCDMPRSAPALAMLPCCTTAKRMCRSRSLTRRPMRLIVPAGVASGTDFAARLFADALAERWKQPVVVENRPGADGLIATTAFVGARDNHTLMYSFAGLKSLLPVIHANLPYDP